MLSMSTNIINWTKVVKKEARGLDDADLGEVQELTTDFVITKTGVVDKKVYSIPKDLAQRFDGHNLWFNLSKEDAENLYKIKD